MIIVDPTPLTTINSAPLFTRPSLVSLPCGAGGYTRQAALSTKPMPAVFAGTPPLPAALVDLLFNSPCGLITSFSSLITTEPRAQRVRAMPFWWCLSSAWKQISYNFSVFAYAAPRPPPFTSAAATICESDCRFFKICVRARARALRTSGETFLLVVRTGCRLRRSSPLVIDAVRRAGSGHTTLDL